MKTPQTHTGTAREPGAESVPGNSGLPRLETVELVTGADPSAAIIWLHGLGADGHDFEPAVPHLLWPGAPAIRFVFPHAPMRAVTINAGMRMRAWYDILNISSERGHDAAGILQSSAQVAELIEREQRRGVAPERVILAGFSQGGAIAMHLALRYSHRLAGLVALSTYLLHASRTHAEAHAINQSLPIFMAHGTMDPIVPFSMGESAANALRSGGYPVDWHTYPIAHSVSPEEIAHISAWLRQRLA